MREIRLIVTVADGVSTDGLTDALGETMRHFEALEWNAESNCKPFGLVLDPDDPGRYAWRFEGQDAV